MMGWEGEKLVSLFSVTGRTLYLESTSENRIEIDIDSFPVGIYILKVENGQHEEFERILLQ